VGCGTGRWAIEMASLFPRANVIGLDIAPPASTMVAGEHVPENYLFMTGNVLEGLPFGDATFDFVHMRLLFTAIPAVRWPQVVRELARVTRRGGWVELVEGALARGGGTALDTINRWVLALGQARGLDLNIGPRVGALLQSAGLSQVVFREILLPLGRYGGRAGQMNATDTFALIEGVRPLVVAQGLTTEQEFNHLLSTARAEVDQPQRQSVRPFYLAYGQRGW
jgi:SAM-dependent methyltransferase